MLSGWHVAHLPARIQGKTRAFQVIDQVVVSWEEFVVEGFLLAPRLFYVPFVPAGADFSVSEFGLVVSSASQVTIKSRRWRKDVVSRRHWAFTCPIVDEQGRFCGHLNDILFDPVTLKVTYLVISRGILGDVLGGALALSVSDIVQMGPSEVKIRALREVLLMK